MVEEGVVVKEGGDKKAVGFLWKVFFFHFLFTLCVCASLFRQALGCSNPL